MSEGAFSSRQAEWISASIDAFSRYRRDCRGAHAIEVVLTMPFFLFFLILLFELSIFYFATSTVEKAAFDYSRVLAEAQNVGDVKSHLSGLTNQIEGYGAPFIKSFKFEIGPARSTVDFKSTINANNIADFLADRKVPVYIRIVAERYVFIFPAFSALWDNAMTNSKTGGLFQPIDILVVVPLSPSA